MAAGTPCTGTENCVCLDSFPFVIRVNVPSALKIVLDASRSRPLSAVRRERESAREVELKYGLK